MEHATTNQPTNQPPEQEQHSTQHKQTTERSEADKVIPERLKSRAVLRSMPHQPTAMAEGAQTTQHKMAQNGTKQHSIGGQTIISRAHAAEPTGYEAAVAAARNVISPANQPKSKFANSDDTDIDGIFSKTSAAGRTTDPQ